MGVSFEHLPERSSRDGKHMSNFTPQEIQTAVEKIVRSTVRHPTGILGERKVETSFSDIQEAAAGVFILYFGAPFYVIMLGARRLQDVLDTQAQTVQSLMDAVVATDRLVFPVSDLTPLANARTALAELESAVSARAQGFADIEQVPAFRRYVQNLDGFLNKDGQNVVFPSSGSGGSGNSELASSIVDTPAGARSKIPALVRDLKATHDELIRRAKLLRSSIDDFAVLNLPQVAAQGVISRARQVLDDRLEELNALDENERLEVLREVVLDLITQKPIVRKYGAATAPSEFINTSRLATAYSDATHPAVPAQVTGNRFGPYNIVDTSHFIRFTMDGGTPFDFPLPLGFVAELNGTLAEPFAITSDRDRLRIVFDDPNDPAPATFVVNLINGTRTATQIVSDVMGVIGATALVCERYFLPLKLDTLMASSSLGGNDARFTLLGGNLSGLDIRVGDQLDVLSGAQAGTTWAVVFVDPAGLYFDTTGALPVVPGSSVRVQAGPAARALRLRDTQPATSLAERRVIRLVRTGGEEDLTAAILGFASGIEARSRPVAAQEVAGNIANSTSQLTAEAVFSPSYYEGRARSSATDAAIVVLSKFEASGTISGGTAPTIALSTPVGNVGIGDKLVIRSSATPGDVGKEGTVFNVTTTTISASFSTAVAAGSCGIEVGPAVVFGFGAVLLITDGVNQGRYVTRETQGVGTSASFELLLESALPIPKQEAGPLVFTASFGQETVRFRSLLDQVTSSVTVENGSPGSAAELFFTPTSLPATARGTTPYLAFAAFPRTASLGDFIQFYEAQYNVVSREFTITGLEPSLSVVQVEPDIESTLNLAFDLNIPNPFGRIRVAQVADFASFRTRLEAWLARVPQQEPYFRELARLLNPVLVNTNPTASQVNDALNQIRALLGFLTVEGAELMGNGEENALEFALGNYKALASEPVDTLLNTLRNKGGDRAIDLLTEGQFSVFFGLDMSGVSYSGTLAQSIRDLARIDLPVRRFNRKQAFGETLLGSIPGGKDFEFDSSDADSPDTPEIPTGSDVASPGENF